MRIKAFKVKCRELKAGDLFSTMGNEYWQAGERDIQNPVGQKVYIRTNIPCPEIEMDEEIYLIKIFKDKK